MASVVTRPADVSLGDSTCWRCSGGSRYYAEGGLDALLPNERRP